MSGNFHEFLRERWTGRLGDVAMRTPGGPALTYQELDERSAQMAAALSGLGVTVGDRVAAQVDKSVDAVALYLACLRAGAVFLPLNTAYTDAEVQFFIRDAEPALVVARPGTLADLGAQVVTMDRDGGGSLQDIANRAEPMVEVVERDGDDLAAMLYTSGTTGRSKGAMLTHSNLTSNALALYESWRFTPDDVLLHTLPIFHAHGLFVALHCAWLGANEIIFLPEFDVDAVVEHLPDATVMMGVPTHYVRLLTNPRFDPDTCRNIRLLTSGSAPMTAALHEEVTARTGHEIVERYGMTEALMITSNPYDGARVPGTVGMALPGVEVRVTDEDGEIVPPDVSGGVEIRSTALFTGYWRLPEKTASEFRDGGWFVTGDVGTLDEEGRLTLEGRAGDMIISGGYNVYPKEIEMVLDQVDGVDETAVIGVPHPDFGEAVVAVVVRDPGAMVDAEEMDAALTGRLARFKHPKHYEFVDALPRNSMSKVQKSDLRASHAGLFTATDA